MTKKVDVVSLMLALTDQAIEAQHAKYKERITKRQLCNLFDKIYYEEEFAIVEDSHND